MAEKHELPEVIDGNSPGFWFSENEFRLFHSSGVPSLSRGTDQFHLGPADPIYFDSTAHRPVWFEAIWKEDDGTLLLWYHHEPGGLCNGNSLTAPKIGAAISYDGGYTIKDLGIVLESGHAINCSAKNGFFGSGHGDFSVVPDQQRKYFYFFFTNYGGPVEQQGVAVARLAFEDRFHPAGSVMKFHKGEWLEPGLGGAMTPIFPAAQAWERADADSYWGPSVHWNTKMQEYVLLMNRSCCSENWPQAGVYWTYTKDLSDPLSWWQPSLIMGPANIGFKPGYYPQVLGLEVGETDSVAGQISRIYVHGRSFWEIVFDPEPGMVAPPEEEDPDPGEPNEPGDLFPLKAKPSMAARKTQPK